MPEDVEVMSREDDIEVREDDIEMLIEDEVIQERVPDQSVQVCRSKISECKAN